MDNLIILTQEAVLDFNWLIAFGLVILYFILDAVFAYYTLSVSQLKAYTAASASAVLYLFSAIGIISYVENFLYVFPITIGAWLGTFYVIRKEKIKKTKLLKL